MLRQNRFHRGIAAVYVVGRGELRTGGGIDPRRLQRPGKPQRAVHGIVLVFVDIDQGDAAMPVCKQHLGDLLRAGDVVHVDAVDIRVVVVAEEHQRALAFMRIVVDAADFVLEKTGCDIAVAKMLAVQLPSNQEGIDVLAEHLADARDEVHHEWVGEVDGSGNVDRDDADFVGS
ncbi:hypothetical protein SDC9_161839 [bioreactor metagenome]|uniref:Uncharacterized protein n=1 Tax=bioreactor metagenome TaxID=1076179 RepID=A0A645FLS7_9ZZZZ